MSGALALAKAAEQPLQVYWFNTGALGCPYRKLFEPINGVEVIDVATGRLRGPLSPGGWRLKAANRRMPYDLFLSGDKLAELADQEEDLVAAVSQAKRCGIETYGRFYGSPRYYEDIVPRPQLTAEAEEILAAAVAGGRARPVGVHIRRGDNDASIQVSPLPLFIERMRKELDRDPDTRFFLATDDPATEDTVKTTFPGRVTTRDKDFSRRSVRGVQDALVDLLVLSRCPVILGSYWSSFSQTAAEMGGGALEIVRTPK